jgi:hypothetical protein
MATKHGHTCLFRLELASVNILSSNLPITRFLISGTKGTTRQRPGPPNCLLSFLSFAPVFTGSLWQWGLSTTIFTVPNHSVHSCRVYIGKWWSSTLTKEIPCLLRTQKFYNRVHKNKPKSSKLCQINSIHTLYRITYILCMYLSIYLSMALQPFV